MKRLLLVGVFIVITYYTGAQYDIQTTILTDIGLITVSKTPDNKDRILISTRLWNEMVAGTKYTAAYLYASKSKMFCIEIASRREGNCRKGIGFGCSIYDCPYSPDPLPNRVDDENRICAVNVKKLKGTIEIIFIDNVNWKSLGRID